MLQIDKNKINESTSLIDKAEGVLIAISKEPTFDSVSSSLSIYLSLIAKGKDVVICSPEEMTVEFSRLVGVDKIQTNIEGGKKDNLVISFPYKEGSVDKVSYNIENGKFQLIIQTREGFPKITPDKIDFNQAGRKKNIDLIFTVGASALEELNSIYHKNQELFNKNPIINIDINPENKGYGKVNIVDSNSSSLSELTANLIKNLNLSLDSDSATNLLIGMAQATSNFTYKNTAQSTFEAAAFCMKKGAKPVRLPDRDDKSSAAETKKEERQKPSFALSQKMAISDQKKQTDENSQDEGKVREIKQADDEKLNQQEEKEKVETTQKQSQPQEEKEEGEIAAEDKKQDEDSKKDSSAPSDWLKPKIYKGSTLL